MNTAEPLELPSLRQLLRATATALVVAAIILVAVVLPAEYGLDPTGVGKRLGIFRPRLDAAPPPTASALPDASSRGGVFKSQTPFRNDEMTLALKPGEGGEIKAAMSGGERFVFSWSAAGGAVDVDMHGEARNAPDGEYTSYWKETSQSGGHGAFEAPVAGTHGWFWQNLGAVPVTVTVRTSGFYEKLLRP